MDRQAIGVHDRVNLAGQASSRATHILTIVVRDAGSVLVHSDYGGVNHLHRRVMTGGKRIHDLVPDASSPPPNEAIVTGGAGTIGFRQVAPWRTRAEDPKDAIEHATVIYPPNAARLVRQHRLDRGPFIIAEFVAHDSRLQFRSLNHVRRDTIKPQYLAVKPPMP
jgi:hypothetical protein